MAPILGTALVISGCATQAANTLRQYVDGVTNKAALKQGFKSLDIHNDGAGNVVVWYKTNGTANDAIKQGLGLKDLSTSKMPFIYTVNGKDVACATFPAGTRFTADGRDISPMVYDAAAGNGAFDCPTPRSTDGIEDVLSATPEGDLPPP